jgi:hypothetical protein
LGTREFRILLCLEAKHRPVFAPVGKARDTAINAILQGTHELFPMLLIPDFGERRV